MRNPWRMQDGPDNKINRNNFPMSFQYNGTFKYGKIYPIGLIRTIPGASYQIDSTLALNFMPTSFPIQTRQRAYVHFFYGRDRNFWKDYKDFVNGMNPELVKPYIDESVTQARTGNLLDYLGVPTTLVGKYGYTFDSSSSVKPSDFVGKTSHFGFTTMVGTEAYKLATLYHDFTINGRPSEPESFPDSNTVISMRGKTFTLADNFTNHDGFQLFEFPISNTSLLHDEVRIPLAANGLLYFNGNIVTTLDSLLSKTIVNTDNTTSTYFSPLTLSQGSVLNRFTLVFLNSGNKVVDICFYPENVGNGVLSFKLDSNVDYSNVSKVALLVPQFVSGFFSNQSQGLSIYLNQENTSSESFNELNPFRPLELQFPIDSNIVRDIDETTSPYWRSDNTTDLRTRIKLNAIPCRMYETVYNLYYRNPQNNPYILNGKPEYNIFIPTKDGGVDSNLYELRYRNWEDDFLTTAVQTPQQGIAPLVGLTDRGATVTLTNEDGSVTRYKTNLDENGNVTGIETTDSSEPLLTQALIDAVSYGISIEDLRNVNAMQKWLELNLRKGYQYKDIIEARWGISISYNELDLPEFIGGFTQEVGLQAVTQTTSSGDTIEGALGWQAGRMYASGEGRSITHYCEEEGYIMALLTVVPVPNYSQLLPKHWFTRDLLDSYQPEFNHIGFQPITYKEVCPIQAYQESTANVDVLEQTFGYQRPWYEYFNQVDEVHGQFRTTFKDFLINRTFNVKPELSESFLLVDPEQVNDVFAVTTDDDKILGAINHRIVAKLPISLYAQARLE